MNKNRIMDHPVLESLGNPKKITFTFDGKNTKVLRETQLHLPY